MTKQRTEFAISTNRQYVKEALDFRNRFAERPFVCRALCQTSDVLVSDSCGQGHFTQHAQDIGAIVIVSDISPPSPILFFSWMVMHDDKHPCCLLRGLLNKRIVRRCNLFTNSPPLPVRGNGAWSIFRVKFGNTFDQNSHASSNFPPETKFVVLKTRPMNVCR